MRDQDGPAHLDVSQSIAAAVQKATIEEALAKVQQLLATRLDLERELILTEIAIKRAWKNVPAMPVRSAEVIDIEERINEKREKRLLKAAKGDAAIASILDELLYKDERSIWRQ